MATWSMVSIHGRGASPPSRGAPKTGTWYEHTRPAATRTARSDALARYAPGPSVTRSAGRTTRPTCDRVKSGFNVWRSHTCAGGRGGGRPHTAAHAGAARTHTSHGHTPHTSVSLLSPGGGPAPGFQKHPGTLRSKIFATRIHRRIQEGSTKGQWKHESEIVSYSYTPFRCRALRDRPFTTLHLPRADVQGVLTAQGPRGGARALSTCESGTVLSAHHDAHVARDRLYTYR